MTSSYALDTATDDTWERVITHAAAALRAVEDTALIGRTGDGERPWHRPAGAEVPRKLWPALAAYAAHPARDRPKRRRRAARTAPDRGRGRPVPVMGSAGQHHGEAGRGSRPG